MKVLIPGATGSVEVPTRANASAAVLTVRSIAPAQGSSIRDERARVSHNGFTARDSNLADSFVLHLQSGICAELRCTHVGGWA